VDLAPAEEPSAATEESTDDLDKATLEELLQLEVMAPPDSLFLEMELEHILNMTISATKIEQKLSEAPSIIEVISFQDIQRRGYRTVCEALRSVPGLAIIDDHVYCHVGVRGIFGGDDSASDIVKLMINGQPVSFRSTSENFFGHELIPIEAVKRIEISRGPGSALYGANAFLGVINIITFEGEDELPNVPNHAVAIDGTLTQNEYQKNLGGSASMVAGLHRKGFRGFLAANFHMDDRSGLAIPGWNDMYMDSMHAIDEERYPAGDNYPSPGWDHPARDDMLKNSPSSNDLERVGSAYGSATYRYKTISIALDGNFQYMDRYGEFLSYSYLTHQNRVTYVNSFGRLRFSREADKKGFSFHASAALSGGEPTAKDHLVDPALKSVYMRRHFGYFAFDAMVDASYAFNESNIVTLGVDFTNDLEDLLSIERFDGETGEGTMAEGFGEETFRNVGIYAQGVFNPVKGLGLTLGTRLDHNNMVACNAEDWDCLGSLDDITISTSVDEDEDILVENRGLFQMSNRAGIVYSFPVLGMYAKVLYGSSYKTPSPYQLYHNSMTIAGSVGNPALRPQTADTIEFQIGAAPHRSFAIEADVFYTTITDIALNFKEGGKIVGRNADARTAGIEGKISYNWEDTVYPYVNLSYLFENTVHPKQLTDETDYEWETSILNERVSTGMFPTWSASFGINFRPPGSYINANIDAHYVGRRDASLINNILYNASDLQKTYTLDAYWIFNLTLSSQGVYIFRHNRETVFSVSFRNLPGAYVDPGYGGVDIPSLGPQVLLRVEQEFY